MPYLLKADIKLRLGDSKKFEGCLISAKHVSLCLQQPMDSCPIGVFNQLVFLSLCTCSLYWCRLVLNHTPKLQVLRFELKQARSRATLTPQQICCSNYVDVQTQWEQQRIQVEKNVVMYLLENSPQLKTMAIRSLKWSNDSEKLKMMQELSSMQRTSTKYRLSFT
ncbi:putative FBD domain-containing protein [Arabidopsis thaliana]